MKIKLTAVSFTFHLLHLAFALTAPLTSLAATIQPQKPMLVFQSQWAEKESSNTPLGLRLNQGWYEGFDHFAIKGNQIFIADSVFGRIALFEGNKLVRSYPLPTKWEYGLAVQGNFLYELDEYGFIFKMDLSTQKIVSSSKPVVVEETGVLTSGNYSLYALGKLLVINRNGDGDDICIDSLSLETSTCIDMPSGYLNKDPRAIVLEGGLFVTTEGDFALLHSNTGRLIARAFWPSSKPLYADPAWLFTKDGIYFTQHSIEFVRIYFQPWMKVNK